jgi:hypothetical protein|tara:strand:+ start:168 stop:653 length:486 start_codon:yes stop_codon:yes gene_type:complete
MKVNISMPRNCKNNLSTGGKYQEELLEEAVRFYARDLMSTRMANTLKIKVHVRKTVLKNGTLGQVINNCKGSIKQNEYLITLDSKAFTADMLRTLAHEMIHVMQIATKKLQYRYWKSDKKLHFRWNGEEMGVLANFPYKNQPHEIEAREKQEGLFKRYYFS